MDEYNFWNIYGSLNAHPNTPTDWNENSILYSVEYFLLKLMNHEHDTDLEKAIIHLISEKLKNKENGMWNNIPHQVAIDNPDRFLSNDNMTAMCVFSKLIGATWHEQMFRQIKKRFGTYDNVSGKFNIKRIVHPRDYIFYGILAGDPWCKMMSPLLEAAGYFTFKRAYKVRHGNKIVKTDQEILWWLRLQVYSGSSSFRKYVERRVQERFGGWGNAFAIYFRHKEHPIRKLVDRYNIDYKPNPH